MLGLKLNHVSKRGHRLVRSAFMAGLIVTLKYRMLMNALTSKRAKLQLNVDILHIGLWCWEEVNILNVTTLICYHHGGVKSYWNTRKWYWYTKLGTILILLIAIIYNCICNFIWFNGHEFAWCSVTPKSDHLDYKQSKQVCFLKNIFNI